MTRPRSIIHPRLAACGVAHGFGVRGAVAPAGLCRPQQVHGAEVVRAEDCAVAEPPAADAVVSSLPGVPIGVVTADCVPVLLASRRGSVVAAVHAGWRGLAAGVVPAALAALRDLGGTGVETEAVIGPHIGPCCYEVDAPVLDALALRFESSLADATQPTRAGHALLDLGLLTRSDLVAGGLAPQAVALLPDACTRCDSQRFHSYRRDGPKAGRLLHYVVAGPHET